MTLEEQQVFIDKIKEFILPTAIYMSDNEIRDLIKTVEAANEDLPKGFGDMLFEQIIILKHNRLG